MEDPVAVPADFSRISTEVSGTITCQHPHALPLYRNWSRAERAANGQVGAERWVYKKPDGEIDHWMDFEQQGLRSHKTIQGHEHNVARPDHHSSDRRS